LAFFIVNFSIVFISKLFNCFIKEDT
jgi:hypothetical protein